MKKIVLSLFALASCVGMAACDAPQKDNSHQKRCHDNNNNNNNNNNNCDRCCSSADCK